MPDYSNGKIYTIRCRTDDTLIYVGSTIQSLAVRLGEHKRSSREEKHKNMLIYRTINNDWENWYIELHSFYPCGSREELCRREGEIIRLIGNLNSKIAGRTYKEWEEDHKELRQEYKKEYNKNWNENNKEKQQEYNKNWNENNKERKQEYNKNWYENNKVILKEQVICQCGCMISRAVLKRHLKTQKHINLMEQLTK